MDRILGAFCQTRLLEGLLYLTDDNGLELAEFYIYNATRPILFSVQVWGAR